MGCSSCHYTISDNSKCYSVNHVFDYKNQAFYGTDNGACDCDTTRNSNTSPGLLTGLYRPGGPLTICLCSQMDSMLTRVTAKSKVSLLITFNYTNETNNKTAEIIPNNIYTFQYIENGEFKQCSGKVIDIYRVQSDGEDTLFKIKIDCSVDYANNVVIIKTDQIRGVKEYFKYAEEDTTISNSKHRFGTTLASIINDAIITNAVIDKNNNILDGTIIDGTIIGYTVDGIANGTNSNGHEIYTINGKTQNGRIAEGRILNGVLRSGSVDGIKDDATGIVEKATIKGIISDLVIVNTLVTGGKTLEGTVINPVIKDSVVVDAVITGDDMITTGGITMGNITTGGTTTGGTATGGIASGEIDGNRYNITDGETTGKLTTTGGVVVGGIVIGGTKIGNAIINGVVKGGVCHGGTTTGGTTSNGTLSGNKTANVPIGKDFTHINNTSNKSYIDKQFNPQVEGFGDMTNPYKNRLVVYGNKDGSNIKSNMSDKWAEDINPVEVD